MECHTTLERVARKAKEKCTRDSDSNPERGEQRRFGRILLLVLANWTQKSAVLVQTRILEEHFTTRHVTKRYS